MTPVLGGLIDTALRVLEKVLPDPQAKLTAQLELLRLQLALAQTRINEEEAKSADLFRAGWRPGAGWVCVLGLFYQFLAQPLIAWGSTWAAIPAPPVLQLGDLYGLLFGMLGLGAYRTFEKSKGRA